MKQSLALLRETVETLVSHRSGIPVSRAATPQPSEISDTGSTAPDLGDLSLQEVVSHIGKTVSTSTLYMQLLLAFIVNSIKTVL